MLARGGLVFVLLAGLSCVSSRLDTNRLHAQEFGAIAAIRAVNAAQMQYSSMYSHFAGSLIELGPASGAASASAADLIPADLASGVKQGYRFTLTSAGTGYSITAVPTVFGSTGVRSFYSDQTLTIRENEGPAPATVTSPEVR